ncbi:DUF6404 family protein [Pseudoduganella sp.]|uniref:DUF6404 family protein n=1 Tax=Pseudoduganella sp. TaxID=1880898 RepID=UPI0035B169B0
MKRHPQREAALQHLESLGIDRDLIAPRVLRGLWRVGIDLTPPHFASFWQNFLIIGSYYTVLWGGPMWLLHWSKEGTSFYAGLAYATVAGAMFGGVIATSYERAKRRNGLPAWRDLGRSDKC